MKIIDNDTIKINLFEEEKEVFFSFGIDTELAKIFTDMICESELPDGNVFTDTVTQIISEIADKGDTEIDSAGIKELLQKSFKDSSQNTVKMAKMLKAQTVSYSDAYSRVCSLLLTERDEKGKIVTPVLASEILYAKKFQNKEVKKELEEIFNYAQDRFAKYIEESTKPKN